MLKDGKVTYQLNNIPRDLWIRLKYRAADEMCSIRELIIRSITRYLEGYQKKEE